MRRCAAARQVCVRPVLDQEFPNRFPSFRNLMRTARSVGALTRRLDGLVCRKFRASDRDRSLACAALSCVPVSGLASPDVELLGRQEQADLAWIRPGSIYVTRLIDARAARRNGSPIR